MSASRPNPRYTSVAIGLHWAMALALIGMVILGVYMTELADDAPGRRQFYLAHMSIGVTLLFLTIARIVWRVLNPPPPPLPMPDWQRRASQFVHYGFYAIMLILPLSGWMMLSTASFSGTIQLYNLLPWPQVPGFPEVGSSARESMHETFEFMHKTLAKLLIALLVLHIGAALKHQFMDRDHLIGRVLPGLVPSDPPLQDGRGAWWAFGGAFGLFLLIVLITHFVTKP